MTTPHPPPPRSAPRLFGASKPVASSTPYNAPTYFPPAYFYGGPVATQRPSKSAASLSGVAGGAASSTPYNAPAYFPPAYFYGGEAGDHPIATPTLGPTPYNAPAYFAPAYFYGGPADTSPTPATPPAISGRDGARYAALVDLLVASGRFASVTFGDPSRAGDGGAADHPRAIVTPRGWEESDDYDPILTTRRALFAIRITVRVDGDAYPFDELDQLSADVQAQVDGSGLGGQCVPALTKIRAGSYQTANQYPEWSVDLAGEFTTLVDPPAF